MHKLIYCMKLKMRIYYIPMYVCVCACVYCVYTICYIWNKISKMKIYFANDIVMRNEEARAYLLLLLFFFSTQRAILQWIAMSISKREAHQLPSLKYYRVPRPIIYIHIHSIRLFYFWLLFIWILIRNSLSRVSMTRWYNFFLRTLFIFFIYFCPTFYFYLFIH